ncbi:MAG: glucoamylase family protein [Planctomycetia bacterium]|nr:glucoamylase family protein [Planctomycetia bacterium]
MHMPQPEYDHMLDSLTRAAFAYFVNEANPANGLVKDCTRPGFPSSIAAVGLALAAYPVGVERGLLTRTAAVVRTLTTLRFFWNSPHGTEPDATGYKGFYYHFLDIDTGRRAGNCELSTIDTVLLLSGALVAALYFDREAEEEREIRELADSLYCRADWQWAQNGEATVTHGWKPESGFLPYRWRGYDEATILYLLGLGSPTHPLPPHSYTDYTSTYSWKNIYGYEFLYAGPLFIHQYSHVWIDFRGIQDEYMRAKGIDYFENSNRATHVQQEYAIRNPLQFRRTCGCRHCECCWGITAGDGPGPATLTIDGIERHFFDYLARGAPYGPDDGTIAPWASAASLPFAPEIVLPTIEHMVHVGVGPTSCRYGLVASFNPTFPGPTSLGWVSPWNYGLNQGPLVLMIENYRSGLIWSLMRRCPYLVAGLRQAGFSGGWLESARAESTAGPQSEILQ